MSADKTYFFAACPKCMALVYRDYDATELRRVVNGRPGPIHVCEKPVAATPHGTAGGAE